MTTTGFQKNTKLEYLNQVDFNLEPIFEYKMNKVEANAYKLGLLWIFYSRKHFPDYKHTSNFPKKGDPRKTSLFKHCYKLVSKNILDEYDYKLYVNAQLQILKQIKIGEAHPLIEPGVLSGEKAWVRWQMWKKRYDKIKKVKTEVDLIPFENIKKELDKTKNFFVSTMEELTEDSFKLIAKDVERLVTIQKVSPFYGLLSPWAKKYCKFNDLDIYEPSITKEVKDYFRLIFEYENGSIDI